MAHKGGHGQRAPYRTESYRAAEKAKDLLNIVNEYVKNLYIEGKSDEEINQKVAQLEAELRDKLKTD